MSKSPSNDREESFRVRFLGTPDIPIIVRLFGLYLAVPVTALIGGGAVAAFAVLARSRSRPSEFWPAVAGCLSATVAAVISYQLGRALQTGRRWGVWATMVLCLLASVLATVFFTDRAPGANQAGSIAFFAFALPALVAFLIAIRNLSLFKPLEWRVMQKVKTILKWGLPGVILLLAVAYFGLNLVATRYEQSVNARWAALGISPADFPNRFPRVEANRTARVLTNLIATERIYQQFQESSPYRKLLEPNAPYARAFDMSDAHLPPVEGGWQVLLDIQKKPGDDIGEMPADVVGYLEKHRADFDLMYREIRNQAPQWEMNVSLGFLAPVPNFLDARSIVNLICLDAVNQLRQGKKAEALAALECAWIVSKSYTNRPEIISQLAGNTSQKIILQTLRKVDGVSPEWHARLSDPDWMKRFQVSLACEAYGLTEGAKQYGVAGFDVNAPENQVPFWKRWLSSLSRPLARYWTAEISETYLLVAERAAKLDGCGADPNPFQELQALDGPSRRISPGNQIASVAMVNVSAYWRNAIKNRFLLEMTDKLLKVKEAANGGAPPQTVAGMGSSICPAARWEYKPEPNAFTLTFSRKSGLFDKDNEGEKDGLFKIQWPVKSRQSSVVSGQ